MAVSITKNLTDLWNAETTAGWNTTPAGTYTFSREGTYCIGWSVSNTTSHYYQTKTAIDFTQAANRCIFIWMVSYGQVDTLANGGYRIYLGDGSNDRAYYVGGSDSVPAFAVKGWFCFMLDTQNLPANYAQVVGSSAPNFSAITRVGVGFKTVSKALGGAVNCFLDIARYGTGIEIRGGTSGDPGTWKQVADDDLSSAAGKAYGCIFEFQPGVYGVQGQLIPGDSASGSSHFQDIDAILVFMQGPGDGFYKLQVVGNATGTNKFIQGVKTGSGDSMGGANGVTVLSAGPGVTIDLDDANMDEVHWYGGKFFKITDAITLPTDIASEIAGLVVDQSVQVAANQAIIRNCVFGAVTPVSGAHSAALLWNNSINIKNCDFPNNTDPDVTYAGHAIKHPDAGTYDYDGLMFSGNEYDILFAAASGNLTVNAMNGANPTTYTILGTGSVTIVSPVTLTLTSIPENTLVTLAKVSDRTVLQQSTAGATGEVTYNYGASEIGLAIDVLFMHPDYDPLIGDVLDYTLPSANATIPVALVSDPTYIT
jgi:hypothetical protein